jgi:hypothetical protein
MVTKSDRHASSWSMGTAAAGRVLKSGGTMQIVVGAAHGGHGLPNAETGVLPERTTHEPNSRSAERSPWFASECEVVVKQINVICTRLQLQTTATFLNRGSARDRDWKKNKHRFLNLLAKINRSTENYNSLLKTALTIIIGLLYLQLSDHANVTWAVHIIFMQGLPDNWKLFKGFLQGKKLGKAGLVMSELSTFKRVTSYWNVPERRLGSSFQSHRTTFCTLHI